MIEATKRHTKYYDLTVSGKMKIYTDNIGIDAYVVTLLHGGELDITVTGDGKFAAIHTTFVLPDNFVVSGGKLDEKGRLIPNPGADRIVMFQKCKVLFDSNGGTKTDGWNVRAGFKVSKPEDPKREGSEFLGWYLNGEKFDFNTPITDDTVLVAKWLLNENEKTEVVVPTTYDEFNTKTKIAVTGDEGVKAAGLEEVAKSMKMEHAACNVRTVLSVKKANEMVSTDQHVMNAMNASDPGKKFEFVNVNLSLYVGDDPGMKVMASPGNVVEVVIPYSVNGKKSISLYRYRDGHVREYKFMKEETAGAEGTFYYKNGEIHLFTDEFSIFGFAYLPIATLPANSPKKSTMATLGAVSVLGVAAALFFGRKKKRIKRD